MTKSADTHCPYCALQCAMTLTSPAALTPAVQPGSDPVSEQAAAGTPIALPLLTVAGRDFPTNRGGLCRKGWTSASLLNHTGRVTEPLLKGADGVHRPVELGRGPRADRLRREAGPRRTRGGRRRRVRRRRAHQ